MVKNIFYRIYDLLRMTGNFDVIFGVKNTLTILIHGFLVGSTFFILRMKNLPLFNSFKTFVIIGYLLTLLIVHLATRKISEKELIARRTAERKRDKARGRLFTFSIIVLIFFWMIYSAWPKG
jgi:hypothetical protein